MSKWKCEICGAEFENFHAQGFDNKIYCPLCYFKRENQELKKQLETGKEQYNDLVEEKENLQGQLSNSHQIKTQQKEFIEWLEDMLVSELDIFTVVRVSDVLSKYKEIIGGKHE